MNYDYVVVNDRIIKPLNFRGHHYGRKCCPGRNKGIIEKLLRKGDDDDPTPY